MQGGRRGECGGEGSKCAVGPVAIDAPFRQVAPAVRSGTGDEDVDKNRY